MKKMKKCDVMGIAAVRTAQTALHDVPTEHVVAAFRSAVTHNEIPGSCWASVSAAARRELGRRGEQEALVPLLYDPSPAVRAAVMIERAMADDDEQPSWDALDRAARRNGQSRDMMIGAIGAAQAAFHDVPTEHIVAAYRRCIIEHRRTTTTEINFGWMWVWSAAQRELRRRDAATVLIPLLDDPDPDVRSLTGMLLLPVVPARAEAALEAVAAGPMSFAELGARMTLKRWRETGVAYTDDVPA